MVKRVSKNPQISRLTQKLRSFVAAALALSIQVAVLAQTQLGTLTSSSPFELRGANINPAPGVPNWPVVPGDTFQAGNTPLTLTLNDGSTVILAPHTRVTLGNGSVVRLESGSVHYTLQRAPSEIYFYCKSDKRSVMSRTGDLDCGREAGPAVSALALGGAATAGAAGATAIFLALHNGSPVSPSRCGTVGLPACP